MVSSALDFEPPAREPLGSTAPRYRRSFFSSSLYASVSRWAISLA